MGTISCGDRQLRLEPGWPSARAHQQIISALRASQSIVVISGLWPFMCCGFPTSVVVGDQSTRTNNSKTNGHPIVQFGLCIVASDEVCKSTINDELALRTSFKNGSNKWRFINKQSHLRAWYSFAELLLFGGFVCQRLLLYALLAYKDDDNKEADGFAVGLQQSMMMSRNQ